MSIGSGAIGLYPIGAAPLAGAGQVTRELAAVWSVFVPVAAELPAAWPVSVPVVAALAAAWTVQTSGQVTATLAAAWAVSVPVSSELAAAWPVSVPVTSQLPAAWAVHTPVAAELAAAWRVSVPVTAELAASWSVEAAPSGDDAFILLQHRLVEAFLAAPALAGGNVASNRDTPLASSEAEGLRVYMLGTEADGPAFVGAPQDWRTTWRVDCLVRAENTDPRDDVHTADATRAAAPLLRAAWARAAALQADDLAVIDVQVAARIRWELAEADTLVCAPHFFVEVLHRTDPVTLQPVA